MNETIAQPAVCYATSRVSVRWGAPESVTPAVGM